MDEYMERNDHVVRDLNKSHDLLEKEMKSVNNELDDMLADVRNKLSIQDGKRIWRHFQRFAEYNDLKLLYNKLMPELVKVEQKIIDFTLEIDQSKLIIRRFDESIAHKADKVSIDKLYKYCDQAYLKRQDMSTDAGKMESMMNQNEQVLAEMKQHLKSELDHTNKKLASEIKQITNKLLGSYFENENTAASGTAGSLDRRDSMQKNANSQSIVVQLPTGSQNSVPHKLSHGITGGVSAEINDLLNRKVDKSDLRDLLYSKSSKKDTSLVQDQVVTLHKKIG